MAASIYLRANNGLWVCAEGGGGREVTANRPVPRSWETFTILCAGNPQKAPDYGDRVHLQASNGQYVCAEGGGGREVVANRKSPHEWETFVLCRPPGTTASSAIDKGRITPVAFRTWNGRNYLCAEDGGGRELVANRRAIGPWEVFSLWIAGQPVSQQPVFPITAVRDQEITPGNHMHSWMSLDANGHMSASTHTWTDNFWQGVHAVSNVALLDENMEVIWYSADCICGVAGKIDPTGPHDRVCAFSGTVPAAVLPRIRSVAICHRTDPHSDFENWCKSPAGVAVITVAAVAVALTVAGSLAGPV